MNEVKIEITGTQGSGKTHLVHIIQEALENHGYLTVAIDAKEFKEDRMIASNDYHDVFIEARQIPVPVAVYEVRKEVSND